jgi:hypothetical protein
MKRELRLEVNLTYDTEETDATPNEIAHCIKRILKGEWKVDELMLKQHQIDSVNVIK